MRAAGHYPDVTIGILRHVAPGEEDAVTSQGLVREQLRGGGDPGITRNGRTVESARHLYAVRDSIVFTISGLSFPVASLTAATSVSPQQFQFHRRGFGLTGAVSVSPQQLHRHRFQMCAGDHPANVGAWWKAVGLQTYVM